MICPTLLAEQALIGRFLCENMLENEFRFRLRGSFADDLGNLQLCQTIVKDRRIIHHAIEHVTLENSPHNGSNLHNSFHRVIQSIDASSENSLQRVGNLRDIHSTRDSPGTIISGQCALLDKGPQYLFHEKRVSFGSTQYDLFNLGGHILHLQKRIHQISTLIER